jgi:hypothetical protein
MALDRLGPNGGVTLGTGRYVLAALIHLPLNLDVLEVRPDRVLIHQEPLADLGVVEPQIQQRQDRALVGREPGE